ncbi:hypothetical protein C1N61_27920 (plasmid) [Priestia aryabhattai]
MTLGLEVTGEEIKATSNQSGKGDLHIDGSNKCNEYLINLTEKIQRNYRDILYRDLEIERIAQIIRKKRENIPVIVGELGAGKHSLVELLAQKILNNQIPTLEGHNIYSLDDISLTNSVEKRTELIERAKSIFESLKSSDILYINNTCNLIGSGKMPSVGYDISSVLLPYLEANKFKVMIVTETSKYEETIKTNTLLNNHLKCIEIKPLNKEQTLEVLNTTVPSFERFHNVEVAKDALSVIVELSDKYMKKRNFPQKAIDVLDEACSAASLSSLKKDKKTSTEVIYEELDSDYVLGSVKKEYEISMDITRPIVTDDIALKVIEQITNLPVGKLSFEAKKQLRNLEEDLNRELIGQASAVNTLSRAIKHFRSELTEKKKPIVLFFSGPTGVGKTESAKLLAKNLMFSEDAMIRFNMSEYMEQASLSKLIGTSPGYIGFEQNGRLTEAVNKNPNTIILLDEFEKAHPRISDIFLSIFDEGEIADSKNNVIDFRNTIIILTSNIGTQKKSNLGFQSDQPNDVTKEALNEAYRKEFINRLDEVVTFNSLSKADIEKILDIRIQKYKNHLSKNGITLHIEEEVKSVLVEKGFKPEYGARELLNRVFRKEIEDLVIDFSLEKEVVTQILISYENDQIKAS